MSHIPRGNFLQSSSLSPQENTPDLHTAAKTGNIPVLQRILQQNPFLVNQKHKQLGWSPLYTAVAYKRLKIVQFLIQHSADLNLSNNRGETPLHLVSDVSQPVIAQLLLSNGASPHKQQNQGDSPLHYAVFKGNLEIISMLLSFGSDPNLVNSKKGRTPLHYAVDSNNPDSVLLLIEAGADASKKDFQGQTPLDLSKNQTITQLLLSQEGTQKQQTIYRYFQKSRNRDSINSLMQQFQYNRIYELLKRNNLTEIYQVLVDFGIQSVQELKEFLNNQKLREIGILKPGHRHRLLMSVQSLQSQRATPRKNPKQSRRFNCCKVQNRSINLMVPQSLQSWLQSLNLQQLTPNFVQAGYEDYQSLIKIMKSYLPMTEEILQEQVFIQDRNARRKILRQLQYDSDQQSTQVSVDQPVQSSCQLCIVM